MDIRHDVTELSRRQSYAGALLELSHILDGHFREGVVIRRRAVRVQPEDYARQVRVIGRRTAELIVRLPRPERSAGEVLQLTPPALVADLKIELAIRPKKNLAAIVIATHGLVGIRLQRPQHDDVTVHR